MLAFDEMSGLPVATLPKGKDQETKHDTAVKVEVQKSASEDRRKLIIVLAREVGLTAHEIARLAWSEVQLEQGLIVLEQAQGRRRLALTEKASALLDAAKKSGFPSSDHVFSSPRRSTHLSIRKVQQVLREERETAAPSSSKVGEGSGAPAAPGSKWNV